MLRQSHHLLYGLVRIYGLADDDHDRGQKVQNYFVAVAANFPSLHFSADDSDGRDQLDDDEVNSDRETSEFNDFLQ